MVSKLPDYWPRFEGEFADALEKKDGPVGSSFMSSTFASRRAT